MMNGSYTRGHFIRPVSLTSGSNLRVFFFFFFFFFFVLFLFVVLFFCSV